MGRRNTTAVMHEGEAWERKGLGPIRERREMGEGREKGGFMICSHFGESSVDFVVVVSYFWRVKSQIHNLLTV